MEVEDIIIDDSQPAVNVGNQGSYRNENISILNAAEIMNGSSRQNRVVLDSSARPYSGLLASLRQKNEFLANAECGSNGQDISILETPREGNIQQLGSVLHEGSSGSLSSSDAKCSMCGQLFINYGELMGHLMLHFKETGAGASVSTTTASTTASTTATASTIGRSNECTTCIVCNKTLKTRYSLLRHLNLVHEFSRPANRECGYCGKEFIYNQLRRHIIEFHIKVSNNFYHCLVCLAVFGTLNGSVGDVKNTFDPLSILSDSNNSARVNQPEKPVDLQGSSQTLLTCVDCGSSQMHKVIYKTSKHNLLSFDCCVCSQVQLKACFVKLTCKSAAQYRRHNGLCRLCKLQNDKKNSKEFDQKSRPDQTLGQYTSNVDIVELSDEDEAHTSISGENSIIVCSDNGSVCDTTTTCKESSSSPEEGFEVIDSCKTSVKPETPCNGDDVEIIEEYITEASREQSLVMKEMEDYIIKVEQECTVHLDKEIINLF